MAVAWPLRGLGGGIAAGIFGLEALGGLGGVSFFSQLVVTVLVVSISVAASLLVYGC
jgi:Amt family ammonium transporter